MSHKSVDRDVAGFSLSAMGSYSVGGRLVRIAGEDIRPVRLSPGLSIDHDPNGSFWIEQTYVQYFTPAAPRSPLPVLLIHGGGMTGRTWETTPDGRPGWLQRFLEAGLSTHVVDAVERGRAGFCALPGLWEERPVVRSLEESWDLYRFGAKADFPSRKPFPGSRFPIAALDAFAAYGAPRWPSNSALQLEGLRRVLERIGPCVVVGHSQGGGFALQLGADRPDLAPLVVALEPHGDFSAVEGKRLDGARLHVVMGDFLDRQETWRELEAKTLRAAAAWRGGGGSADVEYLGARGLHGHSHMMMMDEGSDEIADLVVRRILAFDSAGDTRDAAAGGQAASIGLHANTFDG
ncbi:MAG: hypothetical protein MEP57_02275 [Microvirga sp.]|nr:hypothetical protein [Microvirga sp.]